MSRRLFGALTDLGYMVLGASPWLRPLYRRWAASRYRYLAASYAGLAHDDPAYLRPLHALLAELALSPERIVEVGAGTGAATAVLLERYPQATIVAVDISPQMLRQIRGSPSTRLHRVVGDAFALPLCAQRTGFALVHNAPFDLDELIRITRPSGAVAIVLSSARWIPSAVRARLLRDRWPRGWMCVREQTIGAGVLWIFRPRRPVGREPAA